MRLLLDTHCWLWHLTDPGRLNPMARAALLDPENELWLSAASVWEVVIKHALGRLRLPDAPSQYVRERQAASGVRSLAITDAHALRVADLPPHHHDPFDRILVAQALVEQLVLMTADRALAPYESEVLWAGDGTL